MNIREQDAVTEAVAGVPVDERGPCDNLAVVLADYYETHHDNPDDSPLDEDTGVSVWAISRANAMLTRIANAAISALRDANGESDA